MEQLQIKFLFRNNDTSIENQWTEWENIAGTKRDEQFVTVIYSDKNMAFHSVQDISSFETRLIMKQAVNN